jgi:predicted GTPase
MEHGTGGDGRVATIIMGAAGRDFHNFNVVYRDDPRTNVVAFTAAQIPGIAGRVYPGGLAGPLYPEGIPIADEADLERLVREHGVTRVVFAYSDVSHAEVMHRASRALAAGADFVLLGPAATQLAVDVPAIAISAIRTGCGKSQVARMLARHVRGLGCAVSVVRHPMPYGDLWQQRWQRFATRGDLAAGQCTVEEREEYEPHIEAGAVVFAGVDYAEVLARAAAEADVLIWDGGNNDFPFVRPDLHVVVMDALRPGQADAYHPGEAVLRMADIVVVNKVNSAAAEDVARVREEAARLAPGAVVVEAASAVRLEDPGAVRGRRVLVIEDGPTITHGGMPFGAGYVAAIEAGAGEIVDPRGGADAHMRAVFEAHPHIGRVLPAVGYGAEDLSSLARTANASEADVIVNASPADLAGLTAFTKPVVRARYDYADAGEPRLAALVEGFLRQTGAVGAN